MPAAQAAGTLDSKHSGLIRFSRGGAHTSLSTVETTAGETPLEGPAVKGIEGRTPFQLVVARLRTDRVALLSVVVIVLVASFFVVAANIVVDALYADLDPRVRVSWA
jgi:hypothetical protein